MSSVSGAPAHTTGDRGFHPLSVGHLVLGLALLGMSVVTLLYAFDAVDGHTLRWLVPLPWVLAGTVGLTAVGVVGSRRHTQHHPQPSTQHQTGWVSPPTETEEQR